MGILHSEDFFEEGVVLRTEPGHAYITMPKSDECEDCSAKIICVKDDEKNTRTLYVKDPFGVHTGDRVRVTVKGSTVVKAGVMLYGVPLVILVATLFAGLSVLEGIVSSPELWSFLLSVGLLGVYYLVLAMSGTSAARERHLPTITHISAAR